MIWLGILLRKALARVVLPALLRNLVFQPANLTFILSMMNWKSALVGALWKIGNTKYFPKVVLGWMFRIEAR